MSCSYFPTSIFYILQNPIPMSAQSYRIQPQYFLLYDALMNQTKELKTEGDIIHLKSCLLRAVLDLVEYNFRIFHNQDSCSAN